MLRSPAFAGMTDFICYQKCQYICVYIITGVVIEIISNGYPIGKRIVVQPELKMTGVIPKCEIESCVTY